MRIRAILKAALVTMTLSFGLGSNLHAHPLSPPLSRLDPGGTAERVTYYDDGYQDCYRPYYRGYSRGYRPYSSYRSYYRPRRYYYNGY